MMGIVFFIVLDNIFAVELEQSSTCHSGGQFIPNSGEHIAVSVLLLADVPNSETSMPP